jgi:hypothetical protein
VVTDLPAISITLPVMLKEVVLAAQAIGEVVAEEQPIGIHPKMEKHMDPAVAAGTGIRIQEPDLLDNQE